MRHLPNDDEALVSIGPYRIDSLLGTGGAGTVFRSCDTRSNDLVALKVFRRDHFSDESKKRFLREVDILSRIRHPGVVRLLDSGTHDDRTFIVMELVTGGTLGDALKNGRLTNEKAALGVIYEVAGALVSPHENGIVHRDIKPDNILLADQLDEESIGPGMVKLADFGLAREMVAVSETVTRTGSIVGTPAYMSPEQCGTGTEIGPPADVYSLGATLFHMLAGRPPFCEQDPINLIVQHRYQVAPPVTEFASQVSEATDQLVSKCLSKQPSDRFQNASDLTEAIGKILHGTPNAIQNHPIRSPHSDRRAMRYQFEWQLRSPPQKLWPLVCNTDRLNEALNLPSVQFGLERDEQGSVRRTGEVKLFGLALQWDEHPYEWVEGKRMAVERSFKKGPFLSFVSEVELSGANDGGTRLTHQITVQPRGIVGRATANLELGVKTRPALDRVYRRIDDWASQNLDQFEDPFRTISKLPAAKHRVLEQILNSFSLEFPHLKEISEAVGAFVVRSSSQELAHVRVLEFADRFGFQSHAVFEVFVSLTQKGLFDLRWDIICPACRSASEFHPSLAEVQSHANCPACDLDFDVDYTSSVEVVFQVNSRIRQANHLTYCIGGPGHAPHVCAQVRLADSERFRLDLELTVGRYRLCTDTFDCPFTVRDQGLTRHWEITLADEKPVHAPVMRPGNQHLIIANVQGRECKLRIERDVPRRFALSAAQAFGFPFFRDAFDVPAVTAEHLISVRQATILGCRISHGDSDVSGKSRIALKAVTRQIESLGKEHGALAVERESPATVMNAFLDESLASSFLRNLQRMLGRQNYRIAAQLATGPCFFVATEGEVEFDGTVPDRIRVELETVELDELRFVRDEFLDSFVEDNLTRTFGDPIEVDSGTMRFDIRSEETSASS